jgi:hypothetical protein
MLLGDFPKRMCHKKFRIVQKINIAIDRSISRGGVGGGVLPLHPVLKHVATAISTIIKIA